MNVLVTMSGYSYIIEFLLQISADLRCDRFRNYRHKKRHLVDIRRNVATQLSTCKKSKFCFYTRRTSDNNNGNHAEIITICKLNCNIIILEGISLKHLRLSSILHILRSRRCQTRDLGLSRTLHYLMNLRCQTLFLSVLR